MTAEPSQSERVWAALRRVDDPELGINVVDLGLVYAVAVEGKRVDVRMTMTSPACPLGPYITEQARQAILAELPELESIEIELVWEPPWHPGLMAEHVAGAFGSGR